MGRMNTYDNPETKPPRLYIMTRQLAILTGIHQSYRLGGLTSIMQEPEVVKFIRARHEMPKEYQNESVEIQSRGLLL